MVAAPISITIYLTWIFVAFVDWHITPLIPVEYSPPFSIPGLGVAIVFVGLTMLGVFARNFFGRSIIEFGLWIFEKVPVIRSVYGALKQIFETVVSDQAESFKQVGLIEYPRLGMWSVVFVTTETQGEITHHAASDMVSVFLPTTPNPTSGYLLFVPRDEIIILDMSVEEAAKLIISAGIIEPPWQGTQLDDLRAAEWTASRAIERKEHPPVHEQEVEVPRDRVA